MRDFALSWFLCIMTLLAMTIRVMTILSQAQNLTLTRPNVFSSVSAFPIHLIVVRGACSLVLHSE
jgi:hypothetical protein